ncbi:hypothetical protein BDZ94DRAFT_987331 [Collybia nuda]|uniref:Uncharacterized protein n=1 Tax=Collybia nuda TaxID=64659 RepID=A0A9P5XZU9_9AGAR|nr:hypothetical protein BDZ94DRAFT_987331 [Collybia nuda]
MHQEHNIPWLTAASHFKFIRNNPQRTPRQTGLFARNHPRQTEDLNHFSRVFAQTIATFSQTERAKHLESFPSPSTGKLFSDDFRDRYPEYLNKDNQLIEYWISRAKYGDAYQEGPYYNTSEGDLSDVVKILMNESQLPTLLMLARHPQIPLRYLLNLSWGHHFGFSRVAETAMGLYIFFNFASAADILRGGEYLEIDRYRRILHSSVQSMDYCAQQLPHRAFFGWSNQRLPPARVQVHGDLNRLQEYLKELFRLLYQYDIVIRECGVDPEWESVIISAFRYDVFRGLKINYGQHPLEFI